MAKANIKNVPATASATARPRKRPVLVQPRFFTRMRCRCCDQSRGSSRERRLLYNIGLAIAFGCGSLGNPCVPAAAAKRTTENSCPLGESRTTSDAFIVQQDSFSASENQLKSSCSTSDLDAFSRRGVRGHDLRGMLCFLPTATAEG